MHVAGWHMRRVRAETEATCFGDVREWMMKNAIMRSKDLVLTSRV